MTKDDEDDTPSVRMRRDEDGAVMLYAEDVIAYIRHCGFCIYRGMVEKDPALTFITANLLETVADKFASTWIDYSREVENL